MYLLAFFILQNLKKFFRANPDYKDVPFSGPKSPNCPEQFFLVQTTIITFIYLLALFIPQTLKKSYSGSRIMRMCHFWAQNGLFAPNFFLKKNY